MVSFKKKKVWQQIKNIWIILIILIIYPRYQENITIIFALVNCLMITLIFNLTSDIFHDFWSSINQYIFMLLKFWFWIDCQLSMCVMYFCQIFASIIVIDLIFFKPFSNTQTYLFTNNDLFHMILSLKKKNNTLQ